MKLPSRGRGQLIPVCRWSLSSSWVAFSHQWNPLPVKSSNHSWAEASKSQAPSAWRWDKPPIGSPSPTRPTRCPSSPRTRPRIIGLSLRTKSLVCPQTHTCYLRPLEIQCRPLLWTGYRLAGWCERGFAPGKRLYEAVYGPCSNYLAVDTGLPGLLALLAPRTSLLSGGFRFTTCARSHCSRCRPAPGAPSATRNPTSTGHTPTNT
jgi:hypothetical protein